MNKYLIFSDLDGTLADVDHEVNEHTKEVIRQVLDDGHDFYIATGRMMSLVEDVAYNIDPRVKIVASNGGVIQEDALYNKNSMDKQLLKQIHEIVVEHHLPTLFFTDKDILYTHQIPKFFTMSNGYHERYDTQPILKKIEDIEDDLNNFNIINVLTTVRLDEKTEAKPEDIKRLDKARQQLSLLDDLSVASSSPDNLELYPLATSKGNALVKIAKQLDAKNTLVFGDGYNDVSMFKVAHKSVAMDNAPDGVKEIASHKTLSNGDNGVAHFLIHNILK